MKKGSRNKVSPNDQPQAFQSRILGPWPTRVTPSGLNNKFSNTPFVPKSFNSGQSVRQKASESRDDGEKKNISKHSLPRNEGISIRQAQKV